MTYKLSHNIFIDGNISFFVQGRLVNHSKLRPNARMRLISVDSKPVLYLEALMDIEAGILY